MFDRARPSWRVSSGLLVAAALVASSFVATPAAAQIVGKSVPRAAAQSAPSDGMSFSSDGLAAVELPGGGVAVDLQGRFRHYMTVHKGADGTMHFGCTSDREAAHSGATESAEGTR
jgi:hypothetical protein